MIPSSLEPELTPHTGRIQSASSVGGGCISNASRVDAERGTFFLKHAHGEPGGTFEAEAEGLRALREAASDTALRVPEVLHARNAKDRAHGVLLMEWIEPGRVDDAYWSRFGEALAQLHAAPAPRKGADGPYGFGSDNFIGRLPQRNTWHADWVSFLRDERLAPQLDRARHSGHWQSEWSAQAELLLERLGELIPAKPHPSMLHGDLWSGNALAGAGGVPWILDPAAYVGHAEADLAMTELFGGFGASFYAAYRNVRPLEPGYEERRELYNLYHLINHLNHFGAGYAGGVARALERFGR